MKLDVAWLTAAGTARAVEAGELEPQEMVRAHLERIDRHDARVRAYLHVDRDARAEAAGPLAGVTLAVKDNQAVAGMPLTSGSRKWRDRIAESDTESVARARAAGAAILGKTNLPELAASVGTDNDLFGPTHNPWREGFTPGGSSGGSAAAVAAGLATAAFGTDMGGSIRIPASCCGIFGLRPSPGRIPVESPEATRLSVYGPLARSAIDLRALFAVMSGESAAAGPGRRLRIAVAATSPLAVDPACRAACERAAAALEGLGHRIQELAWDPLPALAAYQVVRPVTVAAHPGRVTDYGERLRGIFERGRRTSGPRFYRALREGLTAAGGLRRLPAGECDAILTPTLGLPPMAGSEVPGFLSQAWTEYTQFVLPVSFAGLPAVSMPAGSHQGLPVGVQLVGADRGERELLGLAEELEGCAGFGFQRPPGFD
jgi:Asp-tRNA(Asn)/Glu-tRNA(Gln) amidotransferase A subunit family amidase